MTEMKLHLQPAFFSEMEKSLVELGPLTASTFLFPTGVAGLRLKNERGELVLLPFQGQQIWSAAFNGRNLTMKSMFDAPNPTRDYLQTYGGFLIHCGVSAMGVPAAGDSHALHGELPNAPYQDAYLVAGEDEKGAYLGLSGSYRHTVAFSTNYIAEPLVKLYAGSSLFDVSMQVTNLKNSEMELMYLAHINYRPEDNARLVYSAPCTPESVRVRRSIPSHVHPKPGYREFLEELAQDPSIHNLLRPELLFDPEVVFYLDYLADEQGWAHSMQVHPDRTADYVRHKPAQLEKGVRWICRTPDQDACGFILPATAEPEGYTAEKAKGNIKILPPHGTWSFELQLGALDCDEAMDMETRIDKLVG